MVTYIVKHINVYIREKIINNKVMVMSEIEEVDNTCLNFCEACEDVLKNHTRYMRLSPHKKMYSSGSYVKLVDHVGKITGISEFDLSSKWRKVNY